MMFFIARSAPSCLHADRTHDEQAWIQNRPERGGRMRGPASKEAPASNTRSMERLGHPTIRTVRTAASDHHDRTFVLLCQLGKTSKRRTLRMDRASLRRISAEKTLEAGPQVERAIVAPRSVRG